MSSLKVRLRHVVSILEIDGRLSLGEDDAELDHAVYQALKDGAINLILDMQHLGYMDSTGVGKLVAVQKLVLSHGCEFKLVHPNPRVADLLQITGLAATMDISSDVRDAAFRFKS